VNKLIKLHEDLVENTEAKEFHFDFGVYYITEAQASSLLYKIVALVEGIDAVMGGGYREYEDTPEPA